jgi:hypothetical protein
MRAAILLSASLAFFFVACGGSGGGTPAGPLDVNLTAAGVSPKSFQALSQASLRFVNQDAVDHRISSSNCTELTTPTLAPGANATQTLGPGPKSCSFSDSLHPSAVGFQGTIDVLAPGNGY